MILSPSGKPLLFSSTEPVLIGVCGYARSGKDSIAQELLNFFGYRAKRLAFADALKSYAARSLHTGLVQVDALKNADPDFRNYLIKVGQRERAKDQDTWVREFCSLLTSSCRGIHYVVVTDVRFHNEAAWLLRNSGILIRVVRPGYEPVEPLRSHESEASQLEFEQHVTIMNDETTETLAKRVTNVATNLYTKRALRRCDSTEGVSIDREWEQSKSKG